MGWFDSIKGPKLKTVKKDSRCDSSETIWTKCSHCSEILEKSILVENFQVCPYCNYHFRIGAQERLDSIIDEGSFNEIGKELKSQDPLEFKDVKKRYSDRLNSDKVKTGNSDAIICGTANIDSSEVAIAIMDFKFLGGSMGVVVGEKIAQIFDLALEKRIPAIVFSASGGARMHEGLLSLMQMAKTSASRERLKSEGIPYISVLTDPTTGGSAASFSILGDVNLAEPNALIGFAGPRVIAQTTRMTLPEGFQRSEFLKEHGFIDRIIERKNLKSELAYLIKMFAI